MLPSNTMLLLTGDHIEEKFSDNRGPGAVERGPLSEVQERLDQLRRRLREQFDFVAGLAFPHQAPDGPPVVRMQGQSQAFELGAPDNPLTMVPGMPLQLHCELPDRLRPALFRFDTAGSFAQLAPVTITAATATQTLTYPEQGFEPLRALRDGTHPGLRRSRPGAGPGPAGEALRSWPTLAAAAAGSARGPARRQGRGAARHGQG